MRYAKDLNGKHCPWVKKYQVGETVSNLGAPLVAPTSSSSGLTLGTTTTLTNMVGISYSTVTYVTAQQTDYPTNKAERLISVNVNPHAVYDLLFSGGAAAGTALTQYDVTTASTDGLSVTTGDDWSSPQMSQGTIWGYDGANAGQGRKITSTSTTAATVTVPFELDTVVGNNFLRAPYNPCQSTTVQLTSNLLQANATIAVGTGAPMICVELYLLDAGSDGTTKSHGLFVPTDRIFPNG